MTWDLWRGAVGGLGWEGRGLKVESCWRAGALGWGLGDKGREAEAWVSETTEDIGVCFVGYFGIMLPMAPVLPLELPIPGPSTLHPPYPLPSPLPPPP